MSHYCKAHPRYSAKREPNSLCGECWRLYFYRCPEAKPGLEQVYREADSLQKPND